MDNLRYYLLIFLRRLPYFTIVASVITAIAVIVAMKLPPAYVSQTRLLVEGAVIESGNTNTPAAQEQLQIVEQSLLTRANLLDIARKQNVFDDIAELNPDQIVQAMRARTTVRSSSGRNEATLMTITFEAPRAQAAAGVLNDYLTLIQEEDVRRRKERTENKTAFFEQQVDRLNKELATRKSAILQFKTENSDALPESLDYRLSQQSLLQERLAQLEREMANLRDQRQRLVQIFEATGQVGQAAGPALTPEQQQLQDLRRQLNEALVIFSAENPRVRQLEARIAQVEAVVAAQPKPQSDGQSSGNAQLDLQLAELDTRADILREQRGTTERQLTEMVDTISRTPANVIELDRLQGEHDNTELQYNRAVERLAQASAELQIELRAQGQRITVTEPPAIPSKPSKPNRKLIAGGGGFFGILAGLGLVVLLEVLNRSVRRPEDLVRKLGVSPIATIPHVRTRGEMIRQRGTKLFVSLMILVGVPALVYAVHTYYQPLDLIAERVMNRLGVRW